MYEINLLPSKLQKKINVALKRWIVLLLIISVPSVLGGFYVFTLAELNQLRLKTNNIDRQLELLTPQLNRMEQLRREREKREQQISVLQSLRDNRFSITPILTGIALNMPVDMWLTGISAEYRENYLPRGGFASPGILPVSEGTVEQTDIIVGSSEQQQPEQQQPGPPPNILVLQGISHSQASIGVFVGQLAAMPYFQNIDVVKVNTATSGETGLAFHIEAGLRGVE